MRSLGTKDPAIWALWPPARLLRYDRMGDEPSGFGRNPRGEEQDLTVGSPPRPPPGCGKDRQVLFSPGEAACPPDAASPDLHPRPRPRRPDPRRIRGRCRTRSTRPGGTGRARPRRAENSKGPTLCVGPFTRAVAEGFEPSVSFPTLAFEASSFGRSDTLPRESLDHLGRPSKSDSPHDDGGAAGAGQRSRKKAVRSAAQSVSRTPWITSGRWLSRRSRTTSQSEPAAPAFSSQAP